MDSLDFARVFAALPSPHMLLDRELRFVAVNQAYCDTTMRSMDELRGQRLFDLFPNEGEGGRRLKASFERVLATGEPDTLAYIPYDIPRPEGLGGGMDVRYWTAAHTPIAGPDGSVAFILQNTVDVTEIARMREAASLPFRLNATETRLLERAREAETANQALLAEGEEFRRMFQQAPGFFAVMNGPEHIFTFTSDSYVRLIGGRRVIGQTLRDALPEIVEQGFVELLDSVYRTGAPYLANGARVMLSDADGAPARENFIDFSYTPIRAPNGEVTGVFVQGTDQTEHVLAMRRERLLVDELNHRVKNALATVQSIAAQTFRSTADPAIARTAFEARLQALANAHNVLSDRNWRDAGLAMLVQRETAVHGEERTRVSGPEVRLAAKPAIAISMLLHELATNAAKHGALTSPDGRVTVNWRFAEDDLRIEWSERGGPAATPPASRGFGTRLTERLVTGELGGTIHTTYAPEGFSAIITIPVPALDKGELRHGS